MDVDLPLAAIVVIQLLAIVIIVYRMGKRHKPKYSKKYLSLALSSYDELIEQGCSIEVAHFMTAFYKMHFTRCIMGMIIHSQRRMKMSKENVKICVGGLVIGKERGGSVDLPFNKNLDGWLKEGIGYSFKVSHPLMACVNEAGEYICREQPLGFMKLRGNSFALIHRTLIMKSLLLGILIPVDNCDLGASYQETSISVANIPHSKIGTIISWAQEVKSAPWGDLGEEEEVEVFFPQI